MGSAKKLFCTLQDGFHLFAVRAPPSSSSSMATAITTPKVIPTPSGVESFISPKTGIYFPHFCVLVY